ncbi:hypothetical protein GCM10020256_06980 [Streptomyces thermocoprophilus]
MREAHRQLREPAPQRPLAAGARLPGVLEHLVGVERPSRVQQGLRLRHRLVRRADHTLGLARHALGAVGQGPAEPVPGPGVAGAALAVAVPSAHGPGRCGVPRAVCIAHPPIVPR